MIVQDGGISLRNGLDDDSSAVFLSHLNDLHLQLSQAFLFLYLPYTSHECTESQYFR